MARWMDGSDDLSDELSDGGRVDLTKGLMVVAVLTLGLAAVFSHDRDGWVDERPGQA